MLTFLNKGFILTENRNYVSEVTFVEYANIHKVRMKYVKENVYYIEVPYIKGIGNETTWEIRYEDKYQAEEAYNKILSNWRKYLDRNSTTVLEQKLDTLLSHIDIIPGGKEYDIVKQDFEKKSI